MNCKVNLKMIFFKDEAVLFNLSPDYPRRTDFCRKHQYACEFNYNQITTKIWGMFKVEPYFGYILMPN